MALFPCLSSIIYADIIEPIEFFFLWWRKWISENKNSTDHAYISKKIFTELFYFWGLTTAVELFSYSQLLLGNKKWTLVHGLYSEGFIFRLNTKLVMWGKFEIFMVFYGIFTLYLLPVYPFFKSLKGYNFIRVV